MKNIKNAKRTHRLAILSMLTAAAMTLSFVETLIPPLSAVPGVKIGLANIAIIFTLYLFGSGSAAAVSLVRLLLVSLLFGNTASFFYGLAGAVLSLSLMIILKKFTPLSCVGVSVAGGVAHNIGQIAVACFLLDTSALIYYLPVLILSGTLSGIAVGVLSGILSKRLSPQKR